MKLQGNTNSGLVVSQESTAPEENMRNIVIVRTKAATSDSALKYVSLFVLVFQNAAQVLLIRYARTRKRQDMFLSTSAVFCTEIIKLLACILIISIQERNPIRTLRMIFEQLLGQPIDTLKVCVPSFIYTIQNNLLYVAVSNLAAATFMVTYQLKILTTALFAVIMLGKRLSKEQWISLVVLFIGVSIVQLQEQSTSNKSKVAIAVNSTVPASLTPAAPIQNPTVGITCVIIACLLSGFAGIYFEKILKGTGEISVWMRNIQLAVCAIPISYVTMQAKDGHVVADKGILYGYDGLVFAIIATYALGGLTVAVVVKYADNILKGFATSVAILVSTVASMYLFHYQPSIQFMFGTFLVIVSIYIYSKFPPLPKENGTLPMHVRK